MTSVDASLPVHEAHSPPERVREGALVDSRGGYEALWRESLDQPFAFWSRMSERFVDWIEPWQELNREDLAKGEIAWFLGGKLNVAANCLDRHLAERGDRTAILWEGDEPGDNRAVSYRELHEETCRVANLLRANGVGKGDRVAIYMGMTPEVIVAMLACARIGAVHSVIFGGFSASAIADRVTDSTCKAVITQDEGRRGGRVVPLKANVDAALENVDCVEFVLVHQHTGGDVLMRDGRDIWWHETVPRQPAECEPEEMDAEDPLFILYTSGSTGKPKGVLHTQAGYLLYTAMSFRYTFDYRDGEIYCCAADVGWITGHSYICYGPLANGATSVMFESIPTYPDAGRYWDMVDRLGINILYTAPTAIRALMREGDEWVKSHGRQSLRVLGTVGEPINPEAWRWYHDVVGEGRCSIVDTYWQTETGGHILTGLAGANDMKPGSASLPFMGAEPILLDPDGNVLEGNNQAGLLCMARSWPGMMRTVYGDHERFIGTYFVQYPGYYFTGDGAYRDQDGYYWLTGRVDDVLNVSGHRLGTAEIEGALVGHAGCAEAAVVGYPHEIKGEGIYAYVLLKDGFNPDAELAAELKRQVRGEISPIATPDKLQFVAGLPKTRSGKIMRRILRKVAEGNPDDVGDVTTLAEPHVVEAIIEGAAGAH